MFSECAFYAGTKDDVITYLNSKNLTSLAEELEKIDGGRNAEYCITTTKSGYRLEPGLISTSWKKR